MECFVDEMPKDCIGCPCESEYYCNLLNEDIGCLKWGEVHKNCPLQSISDYTKQVREEVCEKIKKQIFNHFNVKNMEEYENLSLIDGLFTADAVIEMLDTILKEYQK